MHGGEIDNAITNDANRQESIIEVGGSLTSAQLQGDYTSNKSGT